MEKYRLHVYFRHYVHDRDTLERYKKIVNRVNRATKLAKPFRFNVFVNFDPGMPQGLKDEVARISQKLIEGNVDFSVKVAHGAGVALFNVIEESLSNMSVDREDVVICVDDGDSYPIDRPDFLRQLRSLADKVHGEKAILGLAQKTRISLPGADEDYREIDELYFALSMLGRLPVIKSRLLKVPPGYAEYGDPVPGLYCLNMAHPGITGLFEQMEADMKSSDMTRYTGDFYTVLAASQAGKVVTEIVPVEGNPAGSFSLSSISDKSRELGKTSLRKVYLAAVKSQENTERLCRLYPPEKVEKVRDMVLKAMLKR